VQRNLDFLPFQNELVVRNGKSILGTKAAGTFSRSFAPLSDEFENALSLNLLSAFTVEQDRKAQSWRGGKAP
jgi:hypothetical protein